MVRPLGRRVHRVRLRSAVAGGYRRVAALQAPSAPAASGFVPDAGTCPTAHRRGMSDASPSTSRRPRTPPLFRHPSDVARVLGAAVVLAWLTIVAAGGVVSTTERNAFRLLNQLPDWLDGPIRALTQLGWIGAVPTAAAVALLARRRRLPVDLVLAGAAAWVLAKVVKDLAHRGRPGVLLTDVVLRGVPDAGHGFVSGHAAVAAALATVASAHVSRGNRRLLWALVWGVAAARVYSGAHLPLDVLGGVALGWGLGAAVHLLRGTVGHPPSTAAVTAALEQLGLHVTSVEPLRADARGSVPFVAATDGGGVFVKTVGRDQRDADLLYRLGRWLAFRDVGDETPLATAKQRVEHEAYLLLSASRAGVRVPDLVATGVAADGTWLLAERRVPGRDATQPGVLDAASLDALWEQVATLHRARIAHRDLRLANVMVDGPNVSLVDFSFAQAGATDDQLSRDVAELLASSATAAGPRRAVEAALRGAGRAAVERAAVFVQPLAFSAATRSALAALPGRLEALRAELADRDLLAPPRPQLRARPAMLVAVAVAGYATHHVLVVAAGAAQVGSVVGDLRWRWVAAGVVLSALPFVFAALALGAASNRPIGLGRAVVAQLGAMYAGRASLLGRDSAEVRTGFLQACGLRERDANDAVAVTRTVGGVVHAGAFAVLAAIAVAGRLRTVEPPSASSLLLVALAAAALAAAALRLPARRRAVTRRVLASRAALRRLAADRRRSVVLVAAHVGLLAATAAVLLAALRSVSADAPLAATVAVYLAVAAVGLVGPLPGGLGVVEPALAAGLMSLGVEPAAAVAGVIVFRLVTYWLPLAPAAVAYRSLRRGRCC